MSQSTRQDGIRSRNYFMPPDHFLLGGEEKRFGFRVSGFSVRAAVVSVTLDLVSPPPLVEARRRSLPP
ncbi:hypothetical protein Vadar_005331 [Vaccinium darrowii]|uniref:Uncharacterized protein n=1 Tax=Vaccinium darrowii TaxID=229202 RepID=A0ACB7XGN4_9ERIC|nr:hypothetical protein Vadar_005331 [Vaccinium darrowii]